MQSILGNLYYNVDFSFAAFLIDAILFAYVNKRYSDLSFSNKIYKRLLLTATGVSFFNILGAVMLTYYSHISPFLVLLVNSAFYVLFLLFAFIFSEYIESYFYKTEDNFKRNKVNIVLCIIGVILIFALVFTGNVFKLTDNGVEYQTPRYLLYVLPIYFYTYTVIRFMQEHKRIETETIASIIVAGGVTALLITLQTTFASSLLLTDFFASMALIVFFFKLETPDYYELEDTKKVLEKLGDELEVEVARQTKNAEERLKLYNDLSLQTMKTLAETIDARDSNVTGHSFRVADVARLLAVKMGMNDTESDDIYRGGLLHDIGKIGIPDTVLYNDGNLSPEEYEEAKEHTIIGDEILKNITVLPELRKGARSHHERYDGTGYPDGLKGKDIPLAARIISIADAYDAMVAQRRYGRRLTQEEARKEIESGSGTQFDPKIASKMLEIIDEDTDFKLNGDMHMDEFVIDKNIR